MNNSESDASPINGSFFLNPAHLVLSDGTVFAGYAIGHVQEVVTAEVVFHTGMSGYQEILTDPSYAGQIITFTYPHIGNYGVNKEDEESRDIFAKGFIVRDYVDEHSNYRADQSLGAWLKQKKVMGLTGIDTRKLTKHIRDHGALPAAFGTAELGKLKDAAEKATGTDKQDLAKVVSTKEIYSRGKGDKTIVAYDFGIKESILTYLSSLGTVHVVPADTPAEDVLVMKPDGVFLSNGPGDPSAVTYAHKNIADLLGKVPIFGICLGHQLLATALGANTKKLPFGHHGANHPVMNLEKDHVEVTSQNHNYAVEKSSLKDATVTHINLNDDVVEGLKSDKHAAFSVQYHPEAGPGPHDAEYLFEEFRKLMDGEKV